MVAKIQIDNNYCSGDLETNASLLASYNYSPSVQGGYDTFYSAAVELQAIGELDKSKDIYEFIEAHYEKIEGVPESYVYHAESKTFDEVGE